MSTATQKTILVAEEDEQVRAFLVDNLTADGYNVHAAWDVPSAIAKMAAKPDLVIADLNGHTNSLQDRIRRCEGIAKAVSPDTPIIVLTRHHVEMQRVRAFEHGASDVVGKPFSYQELRHRVRLQLDRTAPRPAPVIRVRDLTIDTTSRTIMVRGTRIDPIANKEYALLLALAADPTRVRTKDELLREVWGFRDTRGVTTRTLDSHCCRLRTKLGVHGDHFVVNVWGVGYRLVDGPVPA